MKILITGGHVTPALAVIDNLLTNKKDIRIVFVGRKYSLESEDTLSLEYKEVTKRNIPFRTLSAGRLSRIISVNSLRQLFKIPLGIIQAVFILQEEKPDRVLTFGGYLAFPIACVGWLMGIPVYTHEQTIRPGSANTLIGKFSRKIFYAFPEAKPYFPENKTVFSGNPVRSSIFEIKNKPFAVSQGIRTMYVTGGSLGSHGINEHIATLIPELVKDFFVIHQIGAVKQYNDFEKLKRIRRSLPEGFKERYQPVEHFFDDDIGYVYSMADFVVGRAGANTFFELIHLRKPAILIPLPWSAHQEQMQHARFFERYGLGEVFEQKDPSSRLMELIKKMSIELARYKHNFETLPMQYKTDAADIIVSEITKAE